MLCCLRSSLISALAALALVGRPLLAQNDSTMMGHDSAMMGHDSAMKNESGMMKDHEMKDHAGMEPNMMFMGAGDQKAAGDYEITEAGGKQQLKLTDDFAVATAPDLYLVLANGDTPDKGALYLGKLKQPTGGQTYELPKGKDLSRYTTLLVWSKKEKRAVASAEWHPQSGGKMEHM